MRPLSLGVRRTVPSGVTRLLSPAPGVPGVWVTSVLIGGEPAMIRGLRTALIGLRATLGAAITPIEISSGITGLLFITDSISNIQTDTI